LRRDIRAIRIARIGEEFGVDAELLHPETLAGLHLLAFTVLMLNRVVEIMAYSS
jgi:hypothetical protein